MKYKISRAVSFLALMVCLALAWLNFTARLRSESFKLWFLIFSVVYFVAAAVSLGEKSES